jgi:hypothetical protein
MGTAEYAEGPEFGRPLPPGGVRMIYLSSEHAVTRRLRDLVPEEA